MEPIIEESRAERSRSDEKVQSTRPMKAMPQLTPFHRNKGAGSRKKKQRDKRREHHAKVKSIGDKISNGTYSSNHGIGGLPSMKDKCESFSAEISELQRGKTNAKFGKLTEDAQGKASRSRSKPPSDDDKKSELLSESNKEGG
jgi:hypothetical protein